MYVADEWNALPDDIKSARTVNGFKCLYKRHRESTVALATEGWKEPRSQGATELQNPHQGPNWTAEDHLTMNNEPEPVWRSGYSFTLDKTEEILNYILSVHSNID